MLFAVSVSSAPDDYLNLQTEKEDSVPLLLLCLLLNKTQMTSRTIRMKADTPNAIHIHQLLLSSVGGTVREEMKCDQVMSV